MLLNRNTCYSYYCYVSIVLKVNDKHSDEADYRRNNFLTTMYRS